MPAGLPSFKGLVERVLESLCPSRRKDPLPWKAFDENRFDEVLDILERRTRGGYGREVRAKVREILQENLVRKRPKLDAHVTLSTQQSGRPSARTVRSTAIRHEFAAIRRNRSSEVRKTRILGVIVLGRELISGSLRAAAHSSSGQAGSDRPDSASKKQRLAVVMSACKSFPDVQRPPPEKSRFQAP